MKKFLHPLYLAGLVFLASCGGDDPLPAPEVSFVTDPAVVEVGVPIMFENRSLKASSYLWDFGGGVTSTEISPTVTFDSRGDIYVKLTANTDDGQMVIDSVLINVLERIMTGFLINSYPTTNGDGLAWDHEEDGENQAPDLLIVFFPEDANNNNVLQLGPAPNRSGLPVGSGDVSANNLVLTDDNWQFNIFDFDGAPDEDITQNNIESITGIIFNPVTSDAIKSTGTNGVVSGFIPVSGFNSSNQLVIDVDIFFEIK